MASIGATPYARRPTEEVLSEVEHERPSAGQDGELPEVEHDRPSAGHDASSAEENLPDWVQPSMHFQPPLWDVKVVDAIYVSKIRKDPASWYLLHLGGSSYTPATLATLAFTDDIDDIMDQVTPITAGLELFPVLSLEVSYPKNAAARAALMEGEGVVSFITGTVGHATKMAMTVLQQETGYPIFD